jgi:tRNA (guanine-N7-)-methyltransferase
LLPRQAGGPNPFHPTLYGRRKGKPLSPRRTALMASAYPKLVVDVGRAAPVGLAELFPVAVKAVRLEIGFGGGEHLIGEAERNPGVGFIGVEPFVNGMAKAVAAIVDGGLRNALLFGGDAGDLLAWLPPESLASIDLLYPDPWPKRRHWKRRFVSPRNLDAMARVLAPGGVFRFASDIPSYVEWTLAHLTGRHDFVWTAATADDWRRPFADWIPTRYEAKACAAGRTPTYLEFRRQ